MAAKRAAREQMIHRLKGPLEAELRQAGIDWFEVTGRPKHLWSIYQKMRRRQKAFDEIYDLMAVRVIVSSEPQVERVPVAAHDDLRPGRAALRGADPHARDAPDGGVRHRGALGVQERPA